MYQFPELDFVQEMLLQFQTREFHAQISPLTQQVWPDINKERNQLSSRQLQSKQSILNPTLASRREMLKI